MLAPSIVALTKILRIVENELATLDMALSASKSVCIRYGPRFDRSCSEISTKSGKGLRRVNTCRHRGVFLVASKRFKITLDNNKISFYRSLIAIFQKIGRLASEEVIVHLISVKCLPVLTYGLDACPVCVSDRRSLDFIITKMFMKFFRSARLMLLKTVKLCLIFVECQRWSLIENVNFCKNSARVTILYVKHLHLWQRMSCQACVQLVKVGELLKHLWTNALDCVRYCNCCGNYIATGNI